MTIKDQFIDWLYENYSIGNGNKLIDLEDNGEVQLLFLKDNDLPLDTEIE